MIDGDDGKGIFGVDGLIGSTGVCGNSCSGFGDSAVWGVGTRADGGVGVEIEIDLGGDGVGSCFEVGGVGWGFGWGFEEPPPPAHLSLLQSTGRLTTG